MQELATLATDWLSTIAPTTWIMVLALLLSINLLRKALF